MRTRGISSTVGQLRRALALLRELEAHRAGLTVKECGEILGVGRRQTYRVLRAIEEAGYPLYAEEAPPARCAPYGTSTQVWKLLRASGVKAPLTPGRGVKEDCSNDASGVEAQRVSRSGTSDAKPRGRERSV